MDKIKSLVDLGLQMDRNPEVLVQAAARWLRVRDREGRLKPLIANAAQRRFEERRGRQNIVLKARQMGLTTWVAGRFFLRTISSPGTLTLQVAQTREAAEAIFRIAQRMWEELPEDLRKGPLVRSRANAGQMVFPAMDSEFRVASASDAGAGRGLSIQNLHCSEVSRWPGDAVTTTQTFTGGGVNFPTTAVTAGEYICIWATTVTPGYGTAAGGISSVVYYLGSQTSFPTGAQTYTTGSPDGIAFTMSVTP